MPLYVLSPVLFPDAVDQQGDSIPAREIEKAARRYMANYQTLGVMHKGKPLNAGQIHLVESFVTKGQTTVGGKEIPRGTWIVGFLVHDKNVIADIKSKRLRGVSIGGRGNRTEVTE